MYKLGLTLTIIGVILWPLLLIGIPLLIVGRHEERKRETFPFPTINQDASQSVQS